MCINLKKKEKKYVTRIFSFLDVRGTSTSSVRTVKVLFLFIYVYFCQKKEKRAVLTLVHEWRASASL